MKVYVTPTVEIIALQPQDDIATVSAIHHLARGNNGWGNGDQTAPGGSLFHNGAENNQGGKHHK